MPILPRRFRFQAASAFGALAVGFAVAGAGLLAGCESDDSDRAGNGGTDAVDLGIPDRAWDPGHDDVGWCGETCIQMAAGHYGREIPQAEINRAAGSPPDVTEDDLDAALSNLGIPYASWNDSNSDVDAFIAWIKSWLERGCPVICGTKIYPDENPAWYVDHFVLAVGFNAAGLILNTQLDCDGQILVSYAELASMEADYAFQNRHGRFFGRAITGAR